jgi:hypothetical protein
MKELVFEFKLEFWIKSNWQNQSGPTGLLAQPAHLAWLNWPGSGLGQSNRPIPALTRLSLSLSSSLAIRVAAAATWPLRPSPVTLAADAWTEWSPPLPLPTPPVGIRGNLPSEEIGMVLPLGIHRHQSPPVRCFSQPLLLGLLCTLWCWSCDVTRRWKRRGVVLPVSAR